MYDNLTIGTLAVVGRAVTFCRATRELGGSTVYSAFWRRPKCVKPLKTVVGEITAEIGPLFLFVKAKGTKKITTALKSEKGKYHGLCGSNKMLYKR